MRRLINAAVTFALVAMVAVVPTLGTLPSRALAQDTDGDGCTDEEEAGLDPHYGGMRNSASFWDFYDVPKPPVFLDPAAAAKDGIINIGAPSPLFWGDVSSLYYGYMGTLDNGPANAAGADYDDDLNLNGIEDGAEYDRTPSADPSKPWQSGPPSGAVTMQDMLVLLVQVGSRCSGVGGAPPAPPSPSQPEPLSPADAMAVDADPSTPFPVLESDVSATVGGTFNVDIDITDSASPYFAYQYTATWNEEILSLVGATPLKPAPLDSCPEPAQTAGVAAPNVYGVCNSSTGTTTTFTGATDTLTFECVAPGTSTVHLVTAAEEPLNFRTATMARTGHFIQTNLSDVSVTCQAAAVGGIAELPDVAGGRLDSDGTSSGGLGSGTYAVLAGAAASVLAFAVLATLSVKRWRVR